MDSFMLDSDRDETEEQLLDQGGLDSTEEGFLRGYSEEEDVEECDECGVALHETHIKKEFDGESHKFCSDSCAKEFAESIS